MGMSEALIVLILTILGGGIGTVFGSDLKSYLPRLAVCIVIRAARKLPAEHQERYAEEWLAVLDNKQERAGMIMHALGCYLFAAPRMNITLGGWKIYGTFGKRVLDIYLVLLAAPFVLPLVLLMGLLIRRDGGSAFYVQERIGLNGRVFRIYKLRTMVVDADAKLAAHLIAHPALRAEWEETQKLKTDPRITAAGRLLRKTSLDELPQLWNVVKGDMSLVGPRPMLPEQRALYPGRDYYQVRPGLTGPWQVSDRDTTSFAERADFDANYTRKMSLLRDMTLMLHTVWVVIRGPRN